MTVSANTPCNASAQSFDQLIEAWTSFLPDDVVFEQASEQMWQRPLTATEEALIAQAVAKRQSEFRAGRHALKQAMLKMDISPGPILVGHMRQPLVPLSIQASISHCQRQNLGKWQGFAGALCAQSQHYFGVGLDAEFNELLDPAVSAQILTASEQAMTARYQLPHALIFCIKESIYKACFNVMQCYFDFLDVEVTLDTSMQSFTFTFINPEVGFPHCYDFKGHYVFDDALCLSNALMMKQATLLGDT